MAKSPTNTLRTGSSYLGDLVDGALSGSFVPLTIGKAWFVDPTNGNDGRDGTTPDTAFATIPTAYAAATANRNDTIFYIAGNMTSNDNMRLSSQLVWAKDSTHLFGLCAPTRIGQRARIFQLSTATGLSPLINITANNCMFSNLYIFQGVADNTSLVNVQVTGQRNYFNNVHFAGGGHATQAVDGGASLKLDGGSENTFEKCTIGVDTATAGNGMAGLVFGTTAAATRNRFEECTFLLQASHAGAIFVEILANGSIDRAQIFNRCNFINLSSTAMTQAVAVAAGFDTNNKRLLMIDCTKIGAGKWDNADLKAVYGNMNAVTGADLSGNLVELIS